MATSTRSLLSSIRKLGLWLKSQWIADVPADIALCEFDCRKAHCTYEEWLSCERRISRAAKELMPIIPGEPASSKK